MLFHRKTHCVFFLLRLVEQFDIGGRCHQSRCVLKLFSWFSFEKRSHLGLKESPQSGPIVLMSINDINCLVQRRIPFLKSLFCRDPSICSLKYARMALNCQRFLHTSITAEALLDTHHEPT